MFVCLALLFSFCSLAKPLKVLRSDLADRHRFDNRINVFSTPSLTLEAPSSWPPRPASTILRPTCVADRVAPFQACSPSTHLGDRVVTPIMTSGTSSPMSSMAVTEGGGVGCAFWKGRAYVLKTPVTREAGLQCLEKRTPRRNGRGTRRPTQENRNDRKKG